MTTQEVRNAELLAEHVASLAEVNDLLADDADNAEALEIRQQLLHSIAVLRGGAADSYAAAPATTAAAAEAGDDASAGGDAGPAGGLIGPTIPPAAGMPAEAAAEAMDAEQPAAKRRR